MRILLPIAALLLAAGCSDAGDSGSDQSASPSERPSMSTSASPKPPTTSPVATGPPAQGAPIAAVIEWVEAGKAVDVTGFHTADRDGKTTQLENGIAFTAPSGKTTCVTGMTVVGDGQLACLTELTSGPAKPAAAGPDGQWIPGWIDYPGDTLTVGGLHGDPGQFGYGRGRELSYGQRLKFGDYQCRTDQAGLFCVNYAHQSAARISDAGVLAFGCLKEVAPSADELVGLKFGC